MRYWLNVVGSLCFLASQFWVSILSAAPPSVTALNKALATSAETGRPILAVLGPCT